MYNVQQLKEGWNGEYYIRSNLVIYMSSNIAMGLTYISDRRNKKPIQNFGYKISWKAATIKSMKMEV
jgi:hypothetical protein